MDERSTFERADLFCFAQIALGTMILFNDNTHTPAHTLFFVCLSSAEIAVVRHFGTGSLTFQLLLLDSQTFYCQLRRSRQT